MEVTLNHAALERLLESETGPVGRYLEEGVQKVVEQAEAQLFAIVRERYQPEVTYSITNDADGLVAELTMVSSGRNAQRLMRKMARADEEESWLKFVRQAFA